MQRVIYERLEALAQRREPAPTSSLSPRSPRRSGGRSGATPDRAAQPLRRAVEPVYRELERDPDTRAAIEAIKRLKQQLAEPPTTIRNCQPASDASSSGAATEIDGVWRMDTDRRAGRPDYLEENWGHWIYVFDRGRLGFTQEDGTACTWGYGTYAVDGNRMPWTFQDGGGIAPNGATNRPGEYFVFDFSTYRDTLTVTPVEGETSPLNFRAEPWRRLQHSRARVFQQALPVVRRRAARLAGRSRGPRAGRGSPAS